MKMNMLGYSHATSGALVWLAAAPAVSQAFGYAMTPQEIAVGAVACAGAALIPDLDHPSATIAYTFGPVSYGAAKLTALLSGGHRQGTHSLLFAGGFGLLCYLVGISSEIWNTNWPAMIMMFLLASFAFRGLNITPPKTSRRLKGTVVIAEAALLTYAMTFFMPSSWWWLGLAGALGCIVHLMGDTLTPEGVPWFYPNRWRASIPIIAHTGNIMEKAIVGPLMTAGVVILAWLQFAPLIA